MALTYQLPTGLAIVEDVKCWQISDRLTGSIRGIVELRLSSPKKPVTRLRNNSGRYRISGFVNERLFVVSYRATKRAVHSAGAVALNGDSSGVLFRGSWAGLAHEEVNSAVCWWVRLPERISSSRKREEFIAIAEQNLKKLVAEVNSRWDWPIRLIGNPAGIGKEALARAVWNVAAETLKEKKAINEDND